MLQMSQMMQGIHNPGAGAGAFPAPGVPSNAPPPAPGSAALAPAGQQAGAGFGGVGFGGAGIGMGAFDPAMMAQMQQFLGGGGAAAPGFGGGGFGGWGAAPAAPADARAPEERFQVQLQQLQDMGFTNAAQNVRALLATAGNVHSAIEYILGGGGI